MLCFLFGYYSIFPSKKQDIKEREKGNEGGEDRVGKIAGERWN